MSWHNHYQQFENWYTYQQYLHKSVLIRLLTSSDVACPKDFHSQHTRDWCVQSWSMVVQSGTPKILLQDEIGRPQKRAARFVTGNYMYETGSMIGILKKIKWESLKKRGKDNRRIRFYKGLH